MVYAYTENFFEESGVELEPSLAALLAGKYSTYLPAAKHAGLWIIIGHLLCLLGMTVWLK